ncbi:MAG: hypothetical protein MJ252_30585 [archaeon]|nr:hypothetical protein [archaeon]
MSEEKKEETKTEQPENVPTQTQVKSNPSNDKKITVSVEDIHRNDTPHIYTLKGTKLKDPLLRKTRDFELLREKLVGRWPGIYIPNFSNRRVRGSDDDETLQLKIDILSNFCDKIMNIPYIETGKEWTTFLENSNDFLRNLDSLNPPTNDEILKQYSMAFVDFDENYDTQEFRDIQVKFWNYLKDIYPKVEKYKDVIKGLKENFSASMKELNTVIKNTSTYEKEVISECADNTENKLILLNTKNENLSKAIKDLQEKIENPYYKLYQYLLEDLLDIEAMLDAFESGKLLQDSYDKIVKDFFSISSELTDIQSGSGGIMAIFGIKNKEEQVKEVTEQKKKLEKEMNNLGQVIKMVTFNMDRQIKKFKENYLKSYYKELESLMKFSVANSKIHSEIYGAILNDPNIKG